MLKSNRKRSESREVNMKVWITKYALTKGILQEEGETFKGNPNYLMVKGYYSDFYGEGNEWHRTKESAIKKAEEMRQKKIASLKKQIEKLEKMKFE